MKREAEEFRVRRRVMEGFPGGSVAKNLPTNAGDTGSIPGPGRSHMLWGKKAWLPQLLEPECLEPKLRN